MMLVNELLEQLKRTIPEVTPQEAYKLQQKGAVLIDIRELEEVMKGLPVGAKHITRSFLEWKAPQLIPNMDTPLLAICASGGRSLFAAQTLKSLGYKHVSSVAGGFHQWEKNQLPVETP